MYTILFVYPTPFLPIKGGVERVTDILAKEFVKAGHRVIYLNNKNPYGDEISSLPVDTFFFPDESYVSSANHSFYKNFLLEQKVDFIINQCGAHGDSTLYCDTAGTTAKVVSVIHFNPYSFYNYTFEVISQLRNDSLKEKFKRIARIILYPKIKSDFLKRLKHHYQWLANNTDSTILLSDSFKDEISQLSPSIKTETIGNPLPFNIEKRLSKENILLWVGRLELKQKRPDLMLKIWSGICKMYPDWRLVMVGDGPDRKLVEKKALALPRVSMTGFVNPEFWYRKARLLCMTSTFEGFEMVLVEAMAKGVIPMAFNSFSAVNDLLQNEIQKIQPFSVSDYQQHIAQLLNDDKLQQDIICTNYQLVENYMPKRIVGKWLDLFHRFEAE